MPSVVDELMAAIDGCHPDAVQSDVDTTEPRREAEMAEMAETERLHSAKSKTKKKKKGKKAGKKRSSRFTAEAAWCSSLTSHSVDTSQP